MRNRLHVIAGVMFVLALGFDFWIWGGLSKAPTLGRIVTDTTARELALATIYVPAGAALLDVSGLGAQAATQAQSLFAPVEPAVLANPEAAMDTLVRDMPWLARLAYYGAPLLLVAFALAWWRRPRVVRSFAR